MKPRIAITLGDPAGIGPEIIAKALHDPRVRRVCRPLVVGQPTRVPMGRPSREAGLCAIEALRRGLLLVETGQADALVTAPVSKESFRLADHGFPGHTEWLAAHCGAPKAVMLMVACPPGAHALRAILLTRHVPLAQVPKHLSARVIREGAELGYAFVKKLLGRARPRLVACGVNPHAGDHGIIGMEEKRIYRPALAALRKRGIRVAGPVPADTAFLHMAKGLYDLALAAYHDQGMIPLKLYAPDQLVNITLGLPFIRTSPGHGTAYDIAGKGKADARPMIEAIVLAARYSRRGSRGAEGAGEW
jgi:4-hydroxythreonine-4-phosphate dehydrogenase